MENISANKTSKLLALAATLSALLSLIISYKAGCAGDSKTGAYGDPVRAIQIEAYSFRFLLLSLTSGWISIVMWPKYHIKKRAFCALLFVVLGGIVLWIGCFHVEDLGVQRCMLLGRN